MKVQEVVANMLAGKSNTISFLGAASKSSADFSSVMSYAGTTTKSSQASFSKQQKDSYEKPVFVKKSSSEISSVKQKEEMQNMTAKTESVKETLTTEGEVPSEEKELLGKKDSIEKLETMIMEILQEDLQISEEDLNQAMEVLGLSYMNLFQEDNLKQLFMEIQGTLDITDVLMDDDLSIMLTQVLQDITVENLAQKTELSEQDIKQVMQTLLGEEEVPVPITENEMMVEQTAIVQGNEQMEGVDQKNKEELVFDQKQVSTDEENAKESLPDVSVVKTISEEKGNLSKENFSQGMQKQSDLAETMVSNIASSAVTETISADGTMTQTIVEIRQVVIQIVQQIKVVIRPEQTDMQMVLHPEHLGRLQLAVSSKNGIMTANFVVQNEMVRNALETQMQELKDAFAEQGLKVEAVEVTVSTFEFMQQGEAGESRQESEQKKQRGKTINMETAFLDEVDIKESENKAAAAISGSGSNVDYIA